jgi:hypothetical protein
VPGFSGLPSMRSMAATVRRCGVGVDAGHRDERVEQGRGLCAECC